MEIDLRCVMVNEVDCVVKVIAIGTVVSGVTLDAIDVMIVEEYVARVTETVAAIGTTCGAVHLKKIDAVVLLAAVVVDAEKRLETGGPLLARNLSNQGRNAAKNDEPVKNDQKKPAVLAQMRMAGRMSSTVRLRKSIVSLSIQGHINYQSNIFKFFFFVIVPNVIFTTSFIINMQSAIEYRHNKASN